MSVNFNSHIGSSVTPAHIQKPLARDAEIKLMDPNVPNGTYQVRESSKSTAAKPLFTLCCKKDKNTEIKFNFEKTEQGYKAENSTFPTLASLAAAGHVKISISLEDHNALEHKKQEWQQQGILDPTPTREKVT